MTPKHFISTDSFNKEQVLEVLKRAAVFRQNKDFTNVARGKIAAMMFFQESTRTVSIFQSAMIKLGGGWLGITNPAGSYVAAGEESVEHTLAAVHPMADVMIVRHKNFDLASVAQNFPIPLINAMCGGEEHSVAALWLAASLQNLLGNLDGLKLGFYGMIKSSRPAKAYIKLFSKFGAEIYEDSVIPEFATPPEIQEHIKQNGAKRTVAPLSEFIDKVDWLIVIEGLPQAGEDESLVKKYNEKFTILGKKDLDKMKKGSYFEYGEPSMMTDGRTIVKREQLDGDPRVINSLIFKDGIYATMGLITYQLDIKV